MGAFDKIQRGVDSSSRPLFATRQMWQHFDRVNALVGNQLVIVQGSFNRGTTQSAGTHDLAGSLDIRTWNLTSGVREAAMWAGRDPGQVGGAAWWYRTLAQGFDYHIHLHLLGDYPQTAQTAFQGSEYRAGRNGLANRGPDDFRRPSTIVNYKFIEDDMTPDQEALLKKSVDLSERILARVDGGFTAEKERDQAEKKREKEIRARERGFLIDRIGREINEASEEEKKGLRRLRRVLLEQQKEDPDATGVDDPSDEALAEATD